MAKINEKYKATIIKGKRAEKYIDMYKKSEVNRIDDCYKSLSYYKILAQNSCRQQQRNDCGFGGIVMNVTQLYNDCKGILWKFARQYNVDISVCEIGFMKAVKNFDETKGANFKTFLTYWLKGACLTEKRNETRDKRKANQNIADYNIEWLGVKQRESLISEIKKALTPSEWNLIYRRYFLGYSQSEIASQKGIGQVTVSRHLQNIYKKLKGVIA